MSLQDSDIESGDGAEVRAGGHLGVQGSVIHDAVYSGVYVPGGRLELQTGSITHCPSGIFAVGAAKVTIATGVELHNNGAGDNSFVRSAIYLGETATLNFGGTIRNNAHAGIYQAGTGKIDVINGAIFRENGSAGSDETAAAIAVTGASTIEVLGATFDQNVYGIFWMGANAKVNVINSTFTANYGGIFALGGAENQGVLTVRSSTFKNHTGGAIGAGLLKSVDLGNQITPGNNIFEVSQFFHISVAQPTQVSYATFDGAKVFPAGTEILALFGESRAG